MSLDPITVSIANNMAQRCFHIWACQYSFKFSQSKQLTRQYNKQCQRIQIQIIVLYCHFIMYHLVRKDMDASEYQRLSHFTLRYTLW